MQKQVKEIRLAEVRKGLNDFLAPEKEHQAYSVHYANGQRINALSKKKDSLQNKLSKAQEVGISLADFEKINLEIGELAAEIDRLEVTNSKLFSVYGKIWAEYNYGIVNLCRLHSMTVYGADFIIDCTTPNLSILNDLIDSCLTNLRMLYVAGLDSNDSKLIKKLKADIYRLWEGLFPSLKAYPSTKLLKVIGNSAYQLNTKTAILAEATKKLNKLFWQFSALKIARIEILIEGTLSEQEYSMAIITMLEEQKLKAFPATGELIEKAAKKADTKKEPTKAKSAKKEKAEKQAEAALNDLPPEEDK